MQRIKNLPVDDDGDTHIVSTVSVDYALWVLNNVNITIATHSRP